MPLDVLKSIVSGHQSVNPPKEAISLQSEKYKRSTLWPILIMQVSISSKTIPQGHELEGEKPLSRDNHCVQKPSLQDRIGSQKPHPRDIKLKNLKNISIIIWHYLKWNVL